MMNSVVLYECPSLDFSVKLSLYGRLSFIKRNKFTDTNLQIQICKHVLKTQN